MATILFSLIISDLPAAAIRFDQFSGVIENALNGFAEPGLYLEQSRLHSLIHSSALLILIGAPIKCYFTVCAYSQGLEEISNLCVTNGKHFRSAVWQKFMFFETWNKVLSPLAYLQKANFMLLDITRAIFSILYRTSTYDFSSDIDGMRRDPSMRAILSGKLFAYEVPSKDVLWKISTLSAAKW